MRRRPSPCRSAMAMFRDRSSSPEPAGSGMRADRRATIAVTSATGVRCDFGNPATWGSRPVALRPRLATGVPVRYLRYGGRAACPTARSRVRTDSRRVGLGCGPTLPRRSDERQSDDGPADGGRGRRERRRDRCVRRRSRHVGPSPPSAPATGRYRPPDGTRLVAVEPVGVAEHATLAGRLGRQVEAVARISSQGTW